MTTRHGVARVATIIVAVGVLAPATRFAPAWLPDHALAAAPPPIAGFTAGKSSWQRQYESQLMAIPAPDVCRAHSIAMSEHPALVGSDWDWRNVEYAVEQLRSYGLDPEVKTYYVYMPRPRSIGVEMIAPSSYVARTKESPFPWQQHFDDIVVGYNAYSPSGDVTADLVYVNYGVPEDYATLEGLGVDVRGKIAIARYGKVFRGVKNEVAAEHGAAGLILFSDPADDGYVKGPVYPDGPWRPADGIQRGTVLYLFDYPGDPLTPGWAATERAPRLAPEDALSLPKGVPTTPLSYGEAEPLLRAMGGPEVPAAWQGGLPFIYHAGPGPAKVRLGIEIDYAITPIRDIVVTIPGTKYPDQWVVLGAHRDGWTYGSNDSVAGYVVVMEIARALAQLRQGGWRPERTIVLGGWDGEEYGQLGSTEWAEEYRQQLRKHAVMYLDLDSAGGGSYFLPSGVPSLDRFLYDVTKEVEEPRTPGRSVFDDWVERSGKAEPPIDRPGGGYDYGAWIDHLGVPTVQMVFDYVASGNYHSTYDDLYFLEHWGDPGYLHHAAMAKMAGVAALRMANADILPFEYSRYAGEVSRYLDELNRKQIDQYGKAAIDLAREVRQNAEWESSALALEGRCASILGSHWMIPRGLELTVARINDRLMDQERDLTQPKGLPGRPWYRHMIYAPGLYTGYGVQFLPALDDAIAAGDWPTARTYRALLHDSLAAATNSARQAVR
jgi:N-acetylated-alpha-linked acidic dipeptidase